jgi:hypothetical protein
VTRNAIALVWLLGIALTAVLYAAGPGHFINAGLAVVSQAEWAIANGIAYLTAQAFDLVRAAAIALFVVFLVLGAMASGRGIRGGGLVGGTVLFVALTTIGGYESRFCWLAAFVVAAAGALGMTQRLLARPVHGPWESGSARRGSRSRAA